MPRASLPSAVALLAAALAFSGCSSGSDTTGQLASTGPTGGGAGQAGSSGSASGGASGGAGDAGASGGAGAGQGGASGGAGAGQGGVAGSGGAGGAGGAAGLGGSSGSAGSGGVKSCGGFVGTVCGDDELCDYPDGSFCGGDDSLGICKPKPKDCGVGCPAPEYWVCACDGQKYCSVCEANKAGADVDGAGACAQTSCVAAADAISTEASIVGSCTAVVRLDYGTLSVLGFDLVCGPYAQTSEAEARATAVAATTFGDTGKLLSAEGDPASFVFYDAPMEFGGVAAVSRRNGLALFGGSIKGLAVGDITYPTAWQPASALGSGCTTSVPHPQAWGFDLTSGSALPPEEVSATIEKVWTTALPDGLMKNGYVFDAVVLLYPRSVNTFDPATAEWVVMVNGGWLE